MTMNLEQYMVFLFVMLRMTGMFVFNPIFGRRNVPTMVNVGMAFVLAVLITATVPLGPLPQLNLVNFFYMVLMELGIGIIAGFIMRMFLAVLTVGGEIIDMQVGLGMAKNFDPGTNASVSVTATMLNAFFLLSFFATNAHLNLIYLASRTYDVLPLGAMVISRTALYYIPELFSTILLLAIKLCLPIVVVELVVTVAVGIIMRIIPQINIFVVNIQFKLLVGIFALLVLVVPLMGFFENLMTICFERIGEAWGYILPIPM